MKFWILLGIVLLILPSVYALRFIDVDLKPGESFFLDGKNITLVNSVNKSTMLCINNELFIVSRDKRVSDILFDFRKATYDKASFKITFDCLHDCQCDGDECQNNACLFDSEELENGDLDNETELISFEESNPECETDLDCDDANVCTLNLCKNNVCKYEPIPGCGLPASNQENDNNMEYIAFSLLAIAILLGVFAIIKSSIKKK